MKREHTTSASESRPSLLQDRSGAVVLVAVFMAVFLTGLLWYAIGVGNAVIHRETLLDGADATAYSAAVYDARGMNVIAMINLIMAAIMAVLVALKIIQILVLAANAISCALCVVGVGCPTCAVTSAWEEPIENAATETQNVVYEVEPPLNKAATVVAIAMPWIAEVRSVIMASSYGPTVHGGLTVSIAQVPGDNTLSMFGSDQEGEGSQGAGSEGSQGTGNEGSQSAGNAGSQSGSNTIPEGSQYRLGLPVENDEPDYLCRAAGTIIDELIKETVGKIPGLGVIFDLVGDLFKFLVFKMPEYFCGGESVDVKGYVGKALNKAKIDPNKWCTTKNIAKHNTQCASVTCPPQNTQCCVHYANAAACQADLKAKTQAANNATDNTNKNQLTAEMSPKRIVVGTTIGDEHFAVFSLVWSELGQGPDKGVSLPSWNRATTPAPTGLGDISYSKAEFYFDEGLGDFTFFHPGGDAPQEIPLDTTYNMRWRARLRRMHETLPQLGTALSNAINTAIENLGSDTGIKIPWILYSHAVVPAENWISHEGALIDQSINSDVKQHLGTGSYTVVH